MPASASLPARLHRGRGLQPAPTFPRSPGIIHVPTDLVHDDFSQRRLFFQGTGNKLTDAPPGSTLFQHNLFTNNNL